MTVFYNGTDATSGIQGYQYALAGAGYSGTAAPIFHLFSGLTTAAHYVDIKAVDMASYRGAATISATASSVEAQSPISEDLPGSRSL